MTVQRWPCCSAEVAWRRTGMGLTPARDYCSAAWASLPARRNGASAPCLLRGSTGAVALCGRHAARTVAAAPRASDGTRGRRLFCAPTHTPFPLAWLQLVSKRPDNVCNFLEGGAYVPRAPRAVA